MLRVPSLKPSRLRGVASLVEVVEVRPKPSSIQLCSTTPMPIRARLRTAWNATSGSSEQACTHRSPPVKLGSRFSFGSAGRLASADGFLPESPKRPSNSEGPYPTVTVSRDTGEPTASPVSTGGAYAEEYSQQNCPAVILAAAEVHSCSRSRKSDRLVP